MTNNEEFRFLDLPKDIRLEIYDLFPAETRRYTVQKPDRPAITPFTLVLERIPCMALLTTCRQIFDEVSAMLGSRLDGQPIRIFADGEDLGNIVTGVLLRCTSLSPKYEDSNTRIKRYIPSHHKDSNDQDVYHVPLQAIRRDTKPGSKLEVEISLELGEKMQVYPPHVHLRLLRDDIRIFYRWLTDLNRLDSSVFFGGPVNITIRPKPLSERTRKWLSEAHLFNHEDCPKEFGLGKTWTVHVGECMTEKEWQRNWKEGKHFGKLKRI